MQPIYFAYDWGAKNNRSQDCESYPDTDPVLKPCVSAIKLNRPDYTESDDKSIGCVNSVDFSCMCLVITSTNKRV